MTTTTWIIAADSSRARILQVMDRDRRLAEVEDFVNPAGRMHDRDLVSDVRDALPQEASAVEHQTELFAKRVGDYLESARTSHRFDRLCLMAPPKFLGQLRKELGAEVRKLVKNELPKDLSWLDAGDIARRYYKA